MSQKHSVLADVKMFSRFLVVGAAFAAGYAIVTAVLTGPLGTPPMLTSIAVYAICIPAAFAVQRRFTFRVSRVRRSGFAAYAAVQLLSLAAVSLVSTRFVTGNVLADAGIYLATAGTAAVVSFAVSRLFAFRPAETGQRRSAVPGQKPG